MSEAIEVIKTSVSTVGCETIFVDGSLGRLVIDDLQAQVSHPPVTVSAMDGYAVRASDLLVCPKTLEQVGISQAGIGFSGKIQSGETVRIFTGAPIPKDTDTIVIQEEVDVSGSKITIKEPVKLGSFVRPAGLDFGVGDVMVPSGTVLSAREVGLLAAMNITTLKVRRRPKVGIIATGNEITMPGSTIKTGQVTSSNSLSVANYVHVFGGIATNIGIAEDTIFSIKNALEEVSGFDLIITIGGASVGDFDLVQKVLDTDDWRLGFYKVAMRPGKPSFFGHYKGIPLLGLPGNPVSVGVVCLILLSEIMGALLGADNIKLPLQRVKIGSDLERNGGRQDYLRAKLEVDWDNNLSVLPFDKQDSSMISNFARADCLIVRYPFAPEIKVGDMVEIIDFSQVQNHFYNF